MVTRALRAPHREQRSRASRLSKSLIPHRPTTSWPLSVRAAAQSRQSTRTEAWKRTRSAVVRMCFADMMVA